VATKAYAGIWEKTSGPSARHLPHDDLGGLIQQRYGGRAIAHAPGIRHGWQELRCHLTGPAQSAHHRLSEPVQTMVLNYFTRASPCRNQTCACAEQRPPPAGAPAETAIQRNRENQNQGEDF